MKRNQPLKNAYWIIAIVLINLLSVHAYGQINGFKPETEAYQNAKEAYASAAQQSATINATAGKSLAVANTVPFSDDEDGCYIPHDPETWTQWVRNDDGSILVELPFSFEFYGEFYTSVYINNNGNLTLNNPFSTFSASGFPFETPMIAPFWGDVDTRNLLSGVVWYQITPTALYVNWPAVGYYNQQVDLLNTFQVIITDGNDPAIGVGNNIAFHYEDMQWTTGSASQGVGGFLGVAATVGINGGGENSAANFFQVGRFRQPGGEFFGPESTENGIDFLDNACFYFDVSSGTNIPPVLLELSSSSQTLCPGQSAEISWTFSGPEPLQNVVVTLNDDPAGTSSSILQAVFGSTASGTLTLEAVATGNYLLTLTATDDGDPVQQTTQSISLVVLACDCDDVPGGQNVPGADCTTVTGAPGIISGNCECEEPIPGCTDPLANNYNPEATEDDGSCEYDSEPIPGCTDPLANNFNPEATEDDGSCTYDPDPLPGCTDPAANNFNPEATEDDGSCEYDSEPIPGCTDEEALNYNPEATEDDGTCEYAPSTGCYGAEIIEYVEGTKLNGTALDADRVDPSEALGEPDRVNAVGGFVSLGYGGSVSIAFDGAVLDQDGDDILVWETSYSSDDCLSDGIEAAQIELSQDGITWIPAGILCRDGAVDIASAGLEWITAIKIINDASSTTFDGYDVDGVEAINGCGPIPDSGCYGSEVLSYFPGPLDNGLPITDPLRIDPTKALGAPQLDDTYNFVSLGYGGELIIGFDGAVINAPGADILVAETTFGNQTFATYPESADVFVSQNGTNFFLVGSLTTNQVGLFDIDDAGQGFDYIIAVKVVDTTPEGSVSEDGFDVDAVEALNGCGPIPEVVNGECAATAVMEYVQGTRSNGGALPANRTNALQATGEPEGTDAMVFVTLGYGGSITLAFDGAVPNEAGDDIEVVETSFGNLGCAAYREYADVSVSQDGVTFFFAKTVCKSDNLVDIDDAGQGWDYVNYVKIENNDVLTTTPDGFDLDGVRALHNCVEDDGSDDDTPSLAFIADAPNVLGSQPNPTSGQSTVFFRTVTTSYTTLEVFDMSGRSIATLYNQVANEGQEYRFDFDGAYLSNGVYIYRLTTENDVVIEKFMIAR